MSPERRAQIESVFEAVLDAPGSERGAILSEACGEDGELRGEVEALLAAHELSDVALDREVAGLAASLLPDPDLDRRIGPYRVLSELGRGGMGVVYLAERDDGHFRRRVAVKILRSSPDALELRRRFLAERQILASLQHPNIAQLLDGGVTDGRIPYLVMEYVDGLPITDYCDRERLDLTARLRLFRDVCAAVHHAHQNLVIHRDLKPGNIFVTERGQVKLLDFGIAKLLNPALSGMEAPVTRTQLRVMTPEYASPEQVRGQNLTTASDVYALGVVLYELLCGHPPYRLSGLPAHEVAELVCEREPERPSTKLLRTERVTSEPGGTREVTPKAIGAARGAAPERLCRILRGDLDAIVLRALRKEPSRRYGSAELLSEDIQRFLDGLPVLAHQGSRSYRLGKFVQRHRIEVAAAALVAVSLLAGAGAATWQAALAGREHARARDALVQAERVTDFLMELFRAADAYEDGSEDVTARDLLRRGSARAEALADQPRVQARLLDVMGQMHYRLGAYDEAATQLERAVALWRAHPGTPTPELAASLVHLSWVHRGRGEVEQARRLVEEALTINQRLLPPDSPELAETFYELGWLAPGREQERLYRTALGILEAAGIRPERRVGMLQALSTNLRRQGRMRDAVETDRAALRLAEGEFGPDDDRTGYAMIHLADHVRDIEGDAINAERLYRRGLELLGRRYGENHVQLIHGLNSLGSLECSRGNHGEAGRLKLRSFEILSAAIGRGHPSVAAQMGSVAEELEHQDRLHEAEALTRQALSRLHTSVGERHPTGSVLGARLASILARQRRHAESDSAFAQAIRVGEGAYGSESVQLGELRREVGRTLLRRGAFAGAEEQLLSSLRILERAYAAMPEHPNVLESKRALMELYTAWDRPELVERFHAPPGAFVRH